MSYRTMHELFRKFASRIVDLIGSTWAFAGAVLFLLAWVVVGAFGHFSNSWWLFFSLSTTGITFLIVFVIQNSQNRDTKAIQIKLDELLRAVNGARTDLVRLEDFSEEELDNLQQEFEQIGAHAAGGPGRRDGSAA